MWQPEFCPNKDCHNHYLSIPPQADNRWYIKKGTTQTKRSGIHQRYQCKNCGTWFSSQTFSLDYYTKRKISYGVLLSHLVSGSGIRDMARYFRCTTTTIQNRIGRLSRNILAVQSRLLSRHPLKPSETLSADGLESFIGSQYYPANINILVGSHSQFLYGYNYFYFKRKGRMTERQKQYREVLYGSHQFEEGGAGRSFSELLDEVSLIISTGAENRYILDTDENRTYDICIRRHPILGRMGRKGLFFHRKTSSREERNRGNPLFSVNYYDREVRKDLAEHRRETVQYARSGNNSMERFNVYGFWHNYLKPYRINKRGRAYESHAEAAGIERGRIQGLMGGLFRYRMFYSRCNLKLSIFQQRLWIRRIINPVAEGKNLLPCFALA